MSSKRYAGKWCPKGTSHFSLTHSCATIVKQHAGGEAHACHVKVRLTVGCFLLNFDSLGPPKLSKAPISLLFIMRRIPVYPWVEQPVPQVNAPVVRPRPDTQATQAQANIKFAFHHVFACTNGCTRHKLNVVVEHELFEHVRILGIVAATSMSGAA